MAEPADKFRENKAARIVHAKNRLRTMVYLASARERSVCASEVEAIFDELDDMVEQTIRVKADVISAAIDGRAQARAAQRQPAVCSSCMKLLTDTEADLEEYIELAVRQACNFSWSVDVCRAKLRAAMKPGDRIALLGYGRVTIVKPDGTSFVVYQRDS
jgi:hypothetical protein